MTEVIKWRRMALILLLAFLVTNGLHVAFILSQSHALSVCMDRLESKPTSLKDKVVNRVIDRSIDRLVQSK